jgi:hypothetical protein
VALEDDYRAYRETIAAGLRILRSHIKVESVTLEALEEELERFNPHVVICSGNKDVELRRKRTWIELSLDPTQPTKISVGGRSLERINPGVDALVEIIDEL